MSNVLLVLSALEPRFLAPERAAALALNLKASGAKRVDLTSNRHFGASASHGAYAVTAFSSAAGGVRQLMGEVVGQSALHDLGGSMEGSRIPGVQTLIRVAEACIRHTGTSGISTNDARDLAMVLYAAIHAFDYDRLFFPHLSGAAQNALYVFGHNMRGIADADYGRPVNLMAIRKRIYEICSISGPAPGQRLN